MIRYLAPEEWDAPPAPFRTAEGGHVWLGADGDFEHDVRVRLTANTTHALLGHGVVDALNALPLMGTLGAGTQVVVPQAVLVQAARILYDADRMTYGAANANWEFTAGDDAAGAPCRIRIDNREYQRGLLRLTDLFNAASRVGYAAWLRI